MTALVGVVFLGEIPEKVSRYSHSPVMIVQRYEGPIKSIIKRVRGSLFFAFFENRERDDHWRNNFN